MRDALTIVVVHISRQQYQPLLNVGQECSLRFIYALKEIRACLEAEMLTDVQQRLALLSRDMDNHNGQRIPHQPAFSRS